jgi:hypothetical protein
MPTATPMMPHSLIGVSNTRVLPNFACRPSVARKTPPKSRHPRPSRRRIGIAAIITSMALS